VPVADQSVDAIVVAQAFHWFDGPAAVAEFHRALRPGGRLAVIWNRRLREQPLHRAISAIIDPYRGHAPTHYGAGWNESILSAGLFTAAGELEVPFEQQFDADGLVDRVASTSFIGALPDAERGRVLDRVRALAADTAPPIRLGYTTEAYVYERR
jgi:SAM-dependent methyltransferase